MIRWKPPGPYEVAFSTRAGGVSEGPFDSLNLGRMTRRRRRAGRREPPSPLRRGRRRSRPARAQPADPLEPRPLRRAGRARRAGRRALDGGVRPARARDERRLPADRARARRRTARRVWPSCTRAGADCWRGSSPKESVRSAAGAHAAIGPAIGPCCYEVGSEVAEPVRGGVRGRRAARPQPRSLDRGRTGAARGGRRRDRARRPLHRLQSRAVLLAPPDREAARRPGSDRACRLRPSGRRTSASAPRSGAA